MSIRERLYFDMHKIDMAIAFFEGLSLGLGAKTTFHLNIHDICDEAIRAHGALRNVGIIQLEDGSPCWRGEYFGENNSNARLVFFS